MKINTKIKHKQIWFDSMIGMTWGFIATLIVGTIIGLLGLYSSHNIFVTIKTALTYMTGFGIGIGVGVKLKLNPLQIFATGIGAFIIGQSLLIPHYHNGSGFNWTNIYLNINQKMFLPGDVFAAWIGSVGLVYIFTIFQWKTFIDILLIPIIGVLLGVFGALWLTYVTTTILSIVEWTVDNTAGKTHLLAILLAPVIGLLMGMALSFPTSSAAIAISISLTGDAATAAMAATAAQMISFGVLTYMTTKSWSKSLAVGFGTSMLQMDNFMKRPKILIIPMFMSALVATIAVSATSLSFPIPKHGSVTSGMGTAGLYGPIFTLKANGWANTTAWMHVIFMQLLIPIVLTVCLSALFLKKKWIKREWFEIKHA